MDVDKEAFDKLKQLDRIEFRQKYKNIVEEYNYVFNISYYVIMFIFVFVIDIWGFIRFGYNIIGNKLIILTLQLFILSILLEFFMALVYTIKRNKQIKNLENEYFIIKSKGDKR